MILKKFNSQLFKINPIIKNITNKNLSLQKNIPKILINSQFFLII